MKIFSSFQNLPHEARGAVIAIGNFDGVHKGHQKLLSDAQSLARSENRPFGVLTFEPHPRMLFRPDESSSRLTPPDIKAWRLEQAGVDVLYSLNFDWPFASLNAEDFIQRVLKDGLGALRIIVGEDFRFGQMRKGEPNDIKAAGIPITLIHEIQNNAGDIYSSSRIRESLRQGDIANANEMLGWPWEIRGEVIKGDQRGRELGYPTANINLGPTIHPAYGVYAAQVNILGEQEWHGAAINIGIRPMFEIPEAQVESYIFDFNREIYGETLRVRPIQRLRSEAKFNSLEELKAQIKQDCDQARAILKEKA